MREVRDRGRVWVVGSFFALAAAGCDPPPTAFPPGPSPTMAPPAPERPLPTHPPPRDAGGELDAPGDASAPSGGPSRSGETGANCAAAADCASGICEGEGCGEVLGRCVPRERPCTSDLRPYCGCDGQTFRSSGSCPGRRFVRRGACP
jgi:hypothetical protein